MYTMDENVKYGNDYTFSKNNPFLTTKSWSNISNVVVNCAC